MSDFWLCGCAECDSQRQDSGQARQGDHYPTMLGASAVSEANRFEPGQALPTQRSKNLSTITCNRIEPQVGKVPPFKMLTRPTELQQRAFELLGVSLGSTH